MDHIKLQLRIVSLIIVTASSAAVQVRNLTGIEGRSITLPDPVKERGFLSYNSKTIATVIKMELDIDEESYRGRILWNNDGHFSITGLQKNDSGIYTIDSTRGHIFYSSYKLIVYESVPVPEVSTLSVNTKSCMLLCSVQKSDAITLSWYEGEELLNQSSSVVSLSVTVHKQNLSNSYQCVASNPVEIKNISVNIAKFCQQQKSSVRMDIMNDTRTRALGIVIPIVCLLSVVLFAVILMWKCLEKTKTTTHSQESDVVYTDVVTTGARNGRQCQNLPGPAVDCLNLTTIFYAKLETHPSC